jgi:hypothetical protein
MSLEAVASGCLLPCTNVTILSSTAPGMRDEDWARDAAGLRTEKKTKIDICKTQLLTAERSYLKLRPPANKLYELDSISQTGHESYIEGCVPAS